MKSKNLRFGLGCAAAGFLLSCCATVLFIIFLQLGLGGTPKPDDVFEFWFLALFWGTLGGAPLGLIIAIYFGLIGTATRAGLFSKLNLRAMLQTIFIGMIPIIVLVVFERLGMSSPESLQSPRDTLLAASWCGGLILPIASGTLYCWFAQRSGSPIEKAPMAFGGAVNAFILGLVLTLSNTAVGFLQNQFGTGNTGDSDVLVQIMVGGMSSAFFLYTVLGAISGLFYSLLARQRLEHSA
jgi:hypothetical protein